MRRIVLPILSLLAVACTNDIYDLSIEEHTAEITTIASTNNAALVFEEASFTIPEHSKAGKSIGFLKLAKGETNNITYSLECDTDIEIDGQTGEMKVGDNLDLDYEQAKDIQFSVSAFNGTTIAEKNYVLEVLDINETDLLNVEEKELVKYFKYLSLWQGPNHNPKNTNRKWKEPMKLHLDGRISKSFEEMVERVIAQYNNLTTSGDFQILLVDESREANAHLHFGEKEDIEDLWPDMYNIIKDGQYDGYAMTPSKKNVLRGTRMWLSNPLESLFKHELGHSLGLGHSNKCEDERSFLCSKIGAANNILPIEEEVIRYMYHDNMPTGLTETEMETVLANLIINEK